MNASNFESFPSIINKIYFRRGFGLKIRHNFLFKEGFQTMNVAKVVIHFEVPLQESRLYFLNENLHF